MLFFLWLHNLWNYIIKQKRYMVPQLVFTYLFSGGSIVGYLVGNIWTAVKYNELLEAA